MICFAVSTAQSRNWSSSRKRATSRPVSAIASIWNIYFRENPLRDDKSRGPPLMIPTYFLHGGSSFVSGSSDSAFSRDWRTILPAGSPVRRALSRSRSITSLVRRIVSVLLIWQNCNTPQLEGRITASRKSRSRGRAEPRGFGGRGSWDWELLQGYCCLLEFISQPERHSLNSSRAKLAGSLTLQPKLPSVL